MKDTKEKEIQVEKVLVNTRIDKSRLRLTEEGDLTDGRFILLKESIASKSLKALYEQLLFENHRRGSTKKAIKNNDRICGTYSHSECIEERSVNPYEPIQSFELVACYVYKNKTGGVSAYQKRYINFFKHHYKGFSIKTGNDTTCAKLFSYRKRIGILMPYKLTD
jgi:hypothetical protein